MHNDHEDRLKNHLISQGSFFSNMIDRSLSIVNPLWSTAQRKLPKNIFNFSIRYISNLLPNRTILSKWGYNLLLIVRSAFSLSPCFMLLRVAQSISSKVDILGVMTLFLTFWQNHFYAYFYPGFISSSALAGDNLRPGLLLVTPDKCLYILEIAVGF